jgi:hypothetical protein
MNAAVAYLVLARGSGRDNRVTAWSTNAVEAYTGISRGRAARAISELCKEGVVERLSGGRHPRYALNWEGTGRNTNRDGDERIIWLPNDLVTESPCRLAPIEQLRQTQELPILRLFVDLYGEHNLRDDGGISRQILSQNFERRRMGEKGQWVIWAFSESGISGSWSGPLLCQRRRPTTRERRDGGTPEWNDAFCGIDRLVGMGLMEWMPYVFEGDGPEAEVLHPCRIGESESYEDRLGQATREAAERMLTFEEAMDAADFPFLVPVARRIENVQMVGIARLKRRPRTRLTASWQVEYERKCKSYLALYSAIVGRK